jgi:GT2 family glycosyltransferase
VTVSAQTSSVDAGSPETAIRTADLSVVVCAFSWARLELTVSAVRSLISQDPRPAEIVVVVDHNDALLEALKERLAGDRSLAVLASEGSQGLSGARNTGIDHATAGIVAFVDDDAEAAPGWTASMMAPFGEEAVVAVGGLAVPVWDGGVPDWFPDELLWAVGCSYAGMAIEGEIRNPLGCNMAFRSGAVVRAGLFDPTLGRLGSLPFGCEETELCVRLRRMDPSVRIVMAPAAVVHHHVPAERATLRYVWRRSYYEGIGKAILHRVTDAGSLGTERDYALKVLTRAMFRDLAGIVRLRSPLVRIRRLAAIVGSLGLAGVGYVVGLLGRTTGPAAAVQKRAAR